MYGGLYLFYRKAAKLERRRNVIGGLLDVFCEIGRELWREMGLASNGPQTGENEGKVKLSFKYPDLFPTLKFAKNPETRKKVFIANENKVCRKLRPDSRPISSLSERSITKLTTTTDQPKYSSIQGSNPVARRGCPPAGL